MGKRKFPHNANIPHNAHHQRTTFHIMYRLSTHAYTHTHTHELFIPRTRLSIYGDRAFTVAAVRIWNSLPQHITSVPPLPVFCSRLKTYFFELCYRNYCCRACEVTLSFMDTLIALTYLLTYTDANTSTKCIIYVFMTILSNLKIREDADRYTRLKTTRPRSNVVGSKQ